MPNETTLYLVAGEASGDNHGAALMTALQEKHPGIRFSGRGGRRMKAVAGGDFADWSESAAVVGLWEVLRRYGYFRQQFKACLSEIANLKPSAVVLIDYPGFNLRLAKALKSSGPALKIVYYISPQVWAWNRGRIPKMARWLDLMLCIFPFEAELYTQSGLPTVFVGHPMVKDLAVKRIRTKREATLIGLFPGSREREVRKLLPLMIEVMNRISRTKREVTFEIAAASEALAKKIREELRVASIPETVCRVSLGASAQLMQRAFVGIIASGTATLEAAYFRLPFVLVYKVSLLTFLAGRFVIRVRHLGMPNILAKKEIVPEFIQGAANGPAVSAAILSLVQDERARESMVAEFDAIIAALGTRDASTAAAGAILQLLG